MKLNITSGECFNITLKKQTTEKCIPFNEAMIDGDAHSDIFSNSFNELRAKNHNVSLNEYIKKIKPLIDIKELKKYSEITLWFGYDAFCQINMLTFLAYLKQIEYNGDVYFIAIDDETEQKLSPKVKVKDYDYLKVYEQVIINKNKYITNDKYLDEAIVNYLDLYYQNDIVSKYVLNNKNKDFNDLLREGLKISKSLGLGDEQIAKIIRRVKSSK